MSIDDEEYFDNLEELIEHYKNDADGLCTKLVSALPKENDISKTLVKGSSKESDDLCVIPEHDLVVSNAMVYWKFKVLVRNSLSRYVNLLERENFAK